MRLAGFEANKNGSGCINKLETLTTMEFSFAADSKTGPIGQVRQAVTRTVVNSALNNSGTAVLPDALLHPLNLVHSTQVMWTARKLSSLVPD
jgi:hypothetical protein